MTTRAVSTVRFVEPMLGLAVSKLPEGPEWAYELKFDWYRAQGIKTAEQGSGSGFKECS